jgi:DNA-binding IclR family transcriptional regulator
MSGRGTLLRLPERGAESVTVGQGQNQSLARGLGILQLFGRDRPELGVADVARLLDIDRTIAHRLIRTLAAAGFLERSLTTQRFRIGPKAFEVGQRYTESNGLYDAALPLLRNLSEQHRLNAYLGTLVDAGVLYLAAVQTEEPIFFRVNPGTRGHLHTTSLGKVLLAGQSDEAARALLEAAPLPRLTQATKIGVAALMTEIRKARRDGHAVSRDENLFGIISVGAPLHDSRGRVVGAISGAAASTGMTKKRLEAIIGAVAQTGQAISHRLGAPGVAEG